MLEQDKTLLAVVDFQDKLFHLIDGHEDILPRALKLVAFAKGLALPILWSEQYKKGLGETLEPMREALEGVPAHEKFSFGCMADEGCRAFIEESGRSQILITGVEAHICVMQTALSALEAGYDVYVVQDAIGSQNPSDFDAACARMRQAGVQMVTTQMAMFELLRAAGTPAFKASLPLLR
jgi:nicotinamidase-related amidase